MVSEDILQMLADSAATFARADPDRARRFRNADPSFDRAAWTKMAEQGWLSIMVPEAQGGHGLGTAAAAVVARELGRAALPEPFVAVGVMAVTCLAQAGDSALWQKVGSILTQGKIIASVAWQGALGAIDIEASEVVARQTDDRVELTGLSRFVPVPSADAFIISARTDTGPALYWVSRDTRGLTIEVERCHDGGALATLLLDQVRVENLACIAAPGNASFVLQKAIDAALVASAAELVGLMDGALSLTLEYMRTRHQFGSAIGSFQALQHRAVDIWIQRQVSEAAVSAAARLLDEPDTQAGARSAAASGAKARAAQAALTLCNQALQLHGAIGFTDEYGLGLYLNRALTLSAWLGSASQHLRRYGELTAFESDAA